MIIMLKTTMEKGGQHAKWDIQFPAGWCKLLVKS